MKELLLVPENAKLIPPPASLTFHAEQDGENIEIIRLTKGTFYFKGEPVEDKNEVYERFSEWMTIANQNK
jgi:hypothetical protein